MSDQTNAPALPPRQPLLHDALVCLTAPTQAWSGPDGQIRPAAGRIDGVYQGDVRVLSGAVVTVGGYEPETIGAAQERVPGGSARVRVAALARHLRGDGADPALRLDRARSVAPGAFDERFRLSTPADGVPEVEVAVAVTVDLVLMDAVKQGAVIARGATAELAADGTLRWSGEGVDVVVSAPDAEVDLADPARPVLRWRVRATPDEPVEVGYALTAADREGPVGPAAGRPWSTPELAGVDDRLVSLVEQGLADLDGLAMSAAATPDDVFLAAGAPWFFTLFGRDSLIAARLLLPLGTDLAGGTLRTLAALQGTKVDVGTAEQPGKIAHEVRRATNEVADGTRLPPLYYGTIDATPLWITLLADARRWGMPDGEVEALLPTLERALGWLLEHADPDGDGFLEYVDLSGHGLANQGWKDSHDSIRWRDGRLAEGTIALCEVQGYAHEAAVVGAELLDVFGRPGAATLRDWAAGMRERFRRSFWVEDADGRYPAIALDGEKRAVDSLTSNIGHLPGTGLLDPEEERLVAARLRSPALASGFGVHTLAATSGGFWPLGYHAGAVWGHDTAMAVLALLKAGLDDDARAVGRPLLDAAPAFGYRLPELFSGDRAEHVAAPAPYPASCRPQAWTAASAVTLLAAELGLRPDVPRSTVRVRPASPGITVRNLRLGGHPLDVATEADGSAAVTTDAAVVVEHG